MDAKLSVHHYTNDGRTWVCVPPPERCVWAMPHAYTVEEAERVHVELGMTLAKIQRERLHEAQATEFARVAAGYQAEIKE